MRALISNEPGGPESLQIGELADPVASAGQVIIKVAACSINYPDVLIIQDLYQIKPPRPFAPGSEVAGIVDSIGEGVKGISVGDRVIALTGANGMAEKVSAAATNIFKMPDDMDFEDGASILMTYGTSIHAYKQRGHIKAGDSVLVLGGSGGIGISAIELAKAYGAKVVAGVSSEEKAAIAKEAGADETVVYPYQPLDKDASKALANTFKAAAKSIGAAEGFDIIYDTVGGDYSEPAVRSIGWEGRFLVVGFPAGIAKLPLNLTLLKSCDVCGIFMGAFAARDPEENKANTQELFDFYAQGKIKPRISARLPLEKGGEGISMLADRKATGKVIVTI